MGCATSKDNTIYVHVLSWTGVDHAAGHQHEDRFQRRAHRREVRVNQTDDGIQISCRLHRQDIDTIVTLKLDGLAADVKPSGVAGSLASGKKVTASNVYQQNPGYRADMALDDEENTRWATDAGTHAAWLEVDLGQPTTFSRVRILQEEAYANRIQKFELQYKDGDDWKTILSGTTTPADYVKDFDPVTARIVRLNILEATEGPTINEFQLFAPKKK